MDKTALGDILRIKQQVDKMELLEFKTQWKNRSDDYSRLKPKDRLRYMVMSIKVLQAKSDFRRMVDSIKELGTHPESERAIYYYLRADLWKFLDNFQYILVVEDANDQEKFEGIELLNDLAETIAQDEDLQRSCINRLRKIQQQIRRLQQDSISTREDREIYRRLEDHVSQLLDNLEPSAQAEKSLTSTLISTDDQKIIQKYLSFSVSRISIEKMGVLKIIQLLGDYPVADLENHQEKLLHALETLEHQTMYDVGIAEARNHCAYGMVVLLEVLKMHLGLPVLLSRIFDLCSYIYFPSDREALERELKALKGRVAEISQKKLRPIIEDILWKNPTYLSKLSHMRTTCPWFYRKDREDLLNFSHIRKVVTESFERLESAPTLKFSHEEMTKSRLSEMVVEGLGLLVNLEPSPRFLKLHTEETKKIRQMQKAGEKSADAQEKLLKKQYHTYKNHLRFLQDSLDYYQGLATSGQKGKGV
ncbi:MAG: hypothetical protein GY801_09615 [bacterium]|nr:hypothetical protein [bacterium]